MDQKKEYNNLKNVLLDKKTEISLRFKKIRNFISSTDEKEKFYGIKVIFRNLQKKINQIIERNI